MAYRYTGYSLRSEDNDQNDMDPPPLPSFQMQYLAAEPEVPHSSTGHHEVEQAPASRAPPTQPALHGLQGVPRGPSGRGNQPSSSEARSQRRRHNSRSRSPPTESYAHPDYRANWQRRGLPDWKGPGGPGSLRSCPSGPGCTNSHLLPAPGMPIPEHLKDRVTGEYAAPCRMGRGYALRREDNDDDDDGSSTVVAGGERTSPLEPGLTSLNLGMEAQHRAQDDDISSVGFAEPDVCGSSTSHIAEQLYSLSLRDESEPLPPLSAAACPAQQVTMSISRLQRD